jgi:hypothetical protein
MNKLVHHTINKSKPNILPLEDWATTSIPDFRKKIPTQTGIIQKFTADSTYFDITLGN